MIRVITRAIEGLSAKLRAKLTYWERLRAKDRPIPHLRPWPAIPEEDDEVAYLLIPKSSSWCFCW